MNKKQLYFFLALVLIFGSSCSTNLQTSDPVTTIVTPSPVVSSPEIINGEGVTLIPDEYYTTKAQRVKIISAGKKMNEVLKSDCAFNFLKNRKFVDDQGKTSEEIAVLVRNASGKIPVQMYAPPFFSKAVAYRQPPELTIHLSYKAFFTYMSDCDWAATIAHESVGHSILNFDHAYKWNRLRDFSIPYSLGGSSEENNDVFQKCCK